VKVHQIDLSEAVGAQDAMRRIAIVRFAEVLALSSALRKRRPQELHDLRIACKRLRYALEHFARFEPSLLEASTRLAQLQDALGETHDRDVLARDLPKELRKTMTRLHAQREASVDRAQALWNDAFAPYGPFEGLVRFTGLGNAYGLGDGVAFAPLPHA
jgi:CHAD domain-containing protein